MKKFIFIFIWIIIIAALVYYLTIHSGEVRKILSISIWNMTLLAILFVITQYLNSLRLKFILKKTGVKLSSKECFHLSNINTVANYLPLKGGTVATAVYFKNRHNISFSKFTNIAVINQIFQLLTIGIISSLLICMNYFQSGVFLTNLFYFFWVLFFMMVLAIFILRELAGRKFLSRLKIKKLNEIAEEAKKILNDNRLMWDLLYVNILSILVMALRFVVAFKALNYSTPFILPFIAGQAKTLAMLVNITPSGIGIAELSAGIVSGLTDKNINIGIYAASIDRVVSILTLLLIFIISAIYFYRHKKLNFSKMKGTENA